MFDEIPDLPTTQAEYEAWEKAQLNSLLVSATETLGKNRARTNLALVQNLFDLVEKHPDMRFSQILSSFGFVEDTGMGKWKDEFFVEPEKTLERVEECRRKERAGQ